MQEVENEETGVKIVFYLAVGSGMVEWMKNTKINFGQPSTTTLKETLKVKENSALALEEKKKREA